MQSFVTVPVYFEGVNPPVSLVPNTFVPVYYGNLPQNQTSQNSEMEGMMHHPIYYLPPPQYIPYIIPPTSAPPLNHMEDIEHKSIKKNEIEMLPITQHSNNTPLHPTSSNESKTVHPTPIIDTNQFASPSSEAFNIQQKKCRKCARFYKEDQNSFDACRFHSGHFQAVYKSTLGMGCLVSWTCCKAYNREAIGCKIGRHLECAATTAAMKRFTHAMEESEKVKELERLNFRKNKRSVSSQSLIDLSQEVEDLTISNNVTSESPKESLYPSLKSEESRIVKQGTTEYIKHNVVLTDTLSGIAIRYNVLVEEIKQANKLTRDEDIWTRFQVLIPFNGQDVPSMDEKERKKCRQDMKARLTKRFRRTTKAGENEARYYLKTCKWDIDEAIKEYNEDMAWEKSNPPKIPLSKKL